MTESAVIIPLRANRAPGQRWQPFIGEEAMRLMAYKGLPGPAAADIQQAAARILGFGQDPSAADGQRTGLVVGYVQSGKTLSFTTVIALARDNSIPIVVVVAGTSIPLFGQTVASMARLGGCMSGTLTWAAGKPFRTQLRPGAIRTFSNPRNRRSYSPL